MLHGIAMHVVQAGQVSVLICQASVPEIVPDFSAGKLVHRVEFARADRVQLFDELAQVGGVRISSRDEMIVIRENSPGFEIPKVFFGLGK